MKTEEEVLSFKKDILAVYEKHDLCIVCPDMGCLLEITDRCDGLFDDYGEKTNLLEVEDERTKEIVERYQ